MLSTLFLSLDAYADCHLGHPLPTYIILLWSIWMFVLGGLALYWVECLIPMILILRFNAKNFVCVFKYLELRFDIEIEYQMLFGW
jgi:hypothetical protein